MSLTTKQKQTPWPTWAPVTLQLEFQLLHPVPLVVAWQYLNVLDIDPTRATRPLYDITDDMGMEWQELTRSTVHPRRISLKQFEFFGVCLTRLVALTPKKINQFSKLQRLESVQLHTWKLAVFQEDPKYSTSPFQALPFFKLHSWNTRKIQKASTGGLMAQQGQSQSGVRLRPPKPHETLHGTWEANLSTMKNGVSVTISDSQKNHL